MVTIPLIVGNNYISFPETSTSNFGILFADIRTIDPTLIIQKYNPILRDFIIVGDSEFIEKGTGYIITINYQANLIYSGIPYILTFDQLKSKLLDGWNLIGPGYSPITPVDWCTVIDPSTGFPVTELEPTKSYWIFSYNCTQPVLNPFLTIAVVSLGISLISLFLSLRGRST